VVFWIMAGFRASPAGIRASGKICTGFGNQYRLPFGLWGNAFPDNDSKLLAYCQGLEAIVKKHSATLADRGFDKAAQQRLFTAISNFAGAVGELGKERGEARAERIPSARDRVLPPHRPRGPETSLRPCRARPPRESRPRPAVPVRQRAQVEEVLRRGLSHCPAADEPGPAAKVTRRDVRHNMAQERRMKRIAFEVGLVVAVIVLGLEAIHYREAVLAANIDNKRAWKTVVELREKCENAEKKPAASSTR
jgi:hypothetical protein